MLVLALLCAVGTAPDDCTRATALAHVAKTSRAIVCGADAADLLGGAGLRPVSGKSYLKIACAGRLAAR